MFILDGLKDKYFIGVEMSLNLKVGLSSRMFRVLYRFNWVRELGFC